MNKGFLNINSDNAASNANSENARSRMEASSWGKYGYGAKGDESSTGHVWAAGFHHIRANSVLAGVLKLMIGWVEGGGGVAVNHE
jgi:hypothetical protein